MISHRGSVRRSGAVDRPSAFPRTPRKLGTRAFPRSTGRGPPPEASRDAGLPRKERDAGLPGSTGRGPPGHRRAPLRAGSPTPVPSGSFPAAARRASPGLVGPRRRPGPPGGAVSVPAPPTGPVLRRTAHPCHRSGSLGMPVRPRRRSRGAWVHSANGTSGCSHGWPGRGYPEPIRRCGGSVTRPTTDGCGSARPRGSAWSADRRDAGRHCAAWARWRWPRSPSTRW